jgi:hypothetical protein
MNTLDIFAMGDGSHWGLSDWYKEKADALDAALRAREDFDTGWYSSKKEIASARIWAISGTIKVEATVSDDFDTVGIGYSSTRDWNLIAVGNCVDQAMNRAEQDRADNEPYIGFTVLKKDSEGLHPWIDTYLMSNGDFHTPPGDYYHWWGWQDSEQDGVGIHNPSIPKDTADQFEKWASSWAFGEQPENHLQIGDWIIRPWRPEPIGFEDPSDYKGMGWVGKDGQP